MRAPVAAPTNGAGVFALSGLGRGAYNVVPALRGFIFQPASQAVTIANADIGGLLQCPGFLP